MRVDASFSRSLNAGIADGVRLQVKHAGDHLQAVLDAVVDFLEQDLMTVERGLQFALVLLLLDRHAEDVRGALQKCDVVLAELAFGSAVDFEHAERRAVALQNDVHRAANAVFNEQFGGTKPLLIFEMVGNNGLAGAQGIAGRRGQVGADGGMADHPFAPADARANQKPVLGRNVFHDFAVFRPQTFGCHPGGVIEHADEARALQGEDAEFSEQLLLTNAQHAARGRSSHLIDRYRASAQRPVFSDQMTGS